MIVAVIDDGVNPWRFPEIRSLAFDLRANTRGKLVKRIKKQPDGRSHGTTCAAIIRKYAPNAEIGSIKVIQDDSLRGRTGQMLTALRWCAEQHIPLIHMSIGSELLPDVAPIRESVQAAQESGCVIVAALSNSSRFTVPACLNGVIGVRTSSILQGEQYYPIEGGLFEVPFAASSRHELTGCDGETRTTSLCNSFAAPLITAKVCSLLEETPGLSGIACIQRLGGRAPDVREQIRQASFLGGPLEAPVFWVLGKPEATIPIMKRLQEQYARYGVVCVLFCDGRASHGLVASSGDRPWHAVLQLPGAQDAGRHFFGGVPGGFRCSGWADLRPQRIEEYTIPREGYLYAILGIRTGAQPDCEAY